jgi:hypothetical protein
MDTDVRYAGVIPVTAKTEVLLEHMDVAQFLQLLIMDLIGTLLAAILVQQRISHVLQDMVI